MFDEEIRRSEKELLESVEPFWRWQSAGGPPSR